MLSRITFAVSLTLVLGGCQPVVSTNAGNSPASPAPEASYLTDEIILTEYRDAIDSIPFPLPDGKDYPPGLPASFQTTDGLLEAGAARNQAWFTWLCAWEDEYISTQKSDKSANTLAASMIENWATSDFYIHVMDDPDRGWVQDVIEPLKSGDPTGVVEDHRRTCTQFPTVDK